MNKFSLNLYKRNHLLAFLLDVKWREVKLAHLMVWLEQLRAKLVYSVTDRKPGTFNHSVTYLKLNF
jgi:hypothetical protein